MERLLPIASAADIPDHYRNTPISLLLEYHNLGRSYDVYSGARLLIGMCMDNRKHLRIPDNFAFIIRAGGANLRYSEFKVSYAVAVGGATCIALIGHNECGMVNLVARKEQFIRGLTETAGWDTSSDAPGWRDSRNRTSTCTATPRSPGTHQTAACRPPTGAAG